MSKSERVWPHVEIATGELRLDSENARIDVKPSASQEEIRRALLESEEIQELAISIAKTGGRMAGERLIVVKNNEKYVVMEGNRRTCACQLLLNPNLMPSDVAVSIPQIDDKTREAIENLLADVAPNRAEADIIVTRRHTESGIKPWSTQANIRRLERLRGGGKSDDDIAKATGISPRRLAQLSDAAALLKRVRSLSCWNAAEKRSLANPDLKTNAFTRFFTLRKVPQRLGMTIDDSGEITTTLSISDFDRALERIARRLLLPDAAKGKPPMNTRATPDEVLSPNGQGKGRTTKQPPPPLFFEGLTCAVSDHHLKALTYEISIIDYRKFKNASAFLLRALMEGCLHHCIRRAGLKRKLSKEYAISTGKPGRDPGLDFMLTFCQQNWNVMFHTNPGRAIVNWRTQKNWCDLVIHGSLMNASSPALEQASAATRQFIEGILSESALK